jgi:hypothetical protein
MPAILVCYRARPGRPFAHAHRTFSGDVLVRAQCLSEPKTPVRSLNMLSVYLFSLSEAFISRAMCCRRAPHNWPLVRALTQLPLLCSYEFSFPVVGLKESSFRTF